MPPLEKVGGSLSQGGSLLRLRDAHVYALLHFSRVTSSAPAGSGALPSGDRVRLRSQDAISTDVKGMFQMPFFP